MTVSLNPRPRSPRKVIVHYGTPSLTVVDFKPEPEPNPPRRWKHNSGITFIWEAGRIVEVK